MTSLRFKFINSLAGLLLAAFTLPLPAAAQERPCGLEHLVGEWVFATDVGRQALVPAEGDITAIGAFHVAADGVLSGIFDVTFEEFMHIPDIEYGGSISVGADCRGVVSFVTATGSMRTDSVVVVNSDLMIAMSRDTNNLWTYAMHRIDRGPSSASINAKLDAIMSRLGLAPGGFELK